jgi:tRNA A-37 threonylcarbamoyl transferase component Bud32
MTLTSGARLGPHEIQSAIGAGGMGEVYEARDTRLDRSVAIKVLPAELSGDRDRRVRFEREAKTIAGLNHPHICTLYDVGEHPSTGPGRAALYLVMEHLTGETLAQRLERGPLPLEQALTLGAEIADALSAAHRQGVIHRDLKPGNVMLTKTGAKLLEFGLAKLKGHGERPAADSLSSAPTRTATLTSEGTIVGTLPYMAPEQVEGKPADARTDLWALGAILYEMVTGTRAFKGASAASLIGHIMNSEPPALATLQPLAPPSVDRLVNKCLTKDPDARWQAASDVADELRWIRGGSGAVASVGGLAAAGVRPGWLQCRPVVWLAAGFVLGMLIVGASLWEIRRAAPERLTTRLIVALAPAEGLGESGIGWSYNAGGSRTAFAWTPDGRALVFAGIRHKTQLLFVRHLGQDAAVPLEGTDGAQVPIVSPDGHWVAFFTFLRGVGVIQRIPVDGGSAQSIAEGLVGAPRGMAWGPGDQILFGASACNTSVCGQEGRIWLTRGNHAPPTPVTELGPGEVTHGLPQWLPGEGTFLYTVRKQGWSWGDEEVVVQSLVTKQRKVVLHDAADARYVPSGHLVFLRMGTLFAVPFDPWA